MKWTVGSLYSNPDVYADRYLVTGDTFAIADGMGLGKGAVLSAEKAIELLKEFRPFHSEKDLERAFLKINKEIIKEIGKLGDTVISGTTLSAISFNSKRFYIGHVGDSRIYLLRNGNLQLLTEDQVKFKGNKKVVKVLGLEWSPRVYTYSDKVQEGDIFLLISDGFVNVIREKELRDLINPENLEESKNRIIETFSERTSSGELTFILIRI
ncbi:MAG TPA: serine/threonine-protein phosphatase [Aquificaceae bacterium]|nr:serine/threonine-protein phosphatase [Aquificaceae bacterium]HIQ49215.1 serine/threonine-protein phosphatase [Aquifex aeolicus]